MNPFGGEQATSTFGPCAVCSSRSTCVVWGAPLCDKCAGAWHDAPGFTAGEVGLDLPHEAYCEKARARMVQWLKKAKAQVGHA